MTRTRAAAAGLGLLGLGLALPFLAAGCATSHGPGGGVAFTYASPAGGRPHPKYYCADCHGVRYFDPYYDVCMRYGYRFAWRDEPQVTAVYRREYVAIRRSDPSVGRYRYPRGAREEAKKKFADERGVMPAYGGPSESSSPAERRAGPPRGPKATKEKDDAREKSGPPRGKTGRGEKKQGEAGTPS